MIPFLLRPNRSILNGPGRVKKIKRIPYKSGNQISNYTLTGLKFGFYHHVYGFNLSYRIFFSSSSFISLIRFVLPKMFYTVNALKRNFENSFSRLFYQKQNIYSKFISLLRLFAIACLRTHTNTHITLSFRFIFLSF